MPKLIAVALVMGSVGLAAAQPATTTPPQLAPSPPSPAPSPAPQQQPPPAPYPYPYPYPPPPYPYANPYAPSPYAPPPPAIYQQPVDEGPRSGHVELVADFAALGLLGTAAALDARDYADKDTGTLLVMGGTLGGGAVGWLLADRFEVTRGEARAATLGLGLGLANGGLLAIPLGADDTSDEVLTTLFVSGTIGATGGLIVGKKLHLSEGQTLFAGNLALLGVGTSAIVSALMDKDDGKVDGGEMTALAIGLDAGAVAGLVLAPRIDWSRRRARYVGVASLAGCFAGSLVGALAASNRNPDGTRSTDPDIAASGLLVGMWGGFVAGIALTGEFAPDPKLATPPATPTTVMPLVGPGHEVGVTIGGGF